MVDGIGSIGSSGISAFGLGGVAPNGGGPAPSGVGDLGAAGLGPIGSSGLAAFGVSGPVGQDAGQGQRFNALVQEGRAQLDRIAADNARFAGELRTPPPSPSFDPPPATPPSFTAPPLAPFGPNVPGIAGLPRFALPPEAGTAPAIARVVGPGAPPLPPDALASSVTSPAIDAPTSTADPFGPIDRGGLGLGPIGPNGFRAFAGQPSAANPADDASLVPMPQPLPQPPGYLAGAPPAVASTGGPSRVMAPGFGAMVAGGPAPMSPDLLGYQMGQRDEPGQTRRPSFLPFALEAQTGQLQFATPLAVDVLDKLSGGLFGAVGRSGTALGSGFVRRGGREAVESRGEIAPNAGISPPIRGQEHIGSAQNLNEARDQARKLSGLGDDAVPFVQERGPIKGRITGVMSPDGSRGWRIDIDEKKGFHVNWWDHTGGIKRPDRLYGAIELPGGQQAYWEALSHFP